MKLRKSINDEYASVLFAIPSSILTSLIYDAIADSSYKIIITEDNTAIIEQVNKFSFLLQFAIIVISFAIIWVVLAIIVPSIANIVEKMTYYKIHTFTINETVERYKKIKNEMSSLIFTIKNYSNKIIYADEFFNHANELHKLFCSKNKSQQKVVCESFRKSNVQSIDDTSELISPYCYSALINEIEIIFNNYFAQNDMVWESDKNDMKKKLTDLKNVIRTNLKISGD